MTISDTKTRIRHARRLMRELRAALNQCRLAELPTAIHLQRDDYEALEWGISHLLKGRVYDEYDADGEPVKSTARLVRFHGGFTLNDGTDNFMFKGVPVRCAEPVGLQR